jgi:hypothetical protein
MEQPICASCGKPIKPTDSRVTIQGVARHMRCWDRAMATARRNWSGSRLHGNTLLTDLHAFFNEHRDCAADMSGGVKDQTDGVACVVWLACDACGARIVRAA